MPIFSIMFFIFSLGNAGTPLTLNFIGEFMSLYGVFERLPLAGALASSSIVFSAAYTIFMFNRIVFAGSFFIQFWDNYIPDINKREFSILLILIIFTVLLGLYPAPLLDGLHYNSYNLIFNTDLGINSNKYLGEHILNCIFDQYDFNKGQINYIDLDEPWYSILENNIDKFTYQTET